MNVAIMGYGPVGQATELMLEKAGINCFIQDPAKNKFVEHWAEISLAFICVPTNDDGNGRLDLDYIKGALKDIPDAVHPVIRSTIGPDQIKEFPQCSVMPEFIREHHWVEDVMGGLTPTVIGVQGEYVSIANLVKKLSQAMMRPILTDAKSAMMMKLSINTFLAMKVAYANNLWIMAKSLGISYDHVKQLIQLDARVGQTHWDVPGPDGKFGYGGKCFPKDTKHFASLMNSPLLDEIIKYTK